MSANSSPWFEAWYIKFAAVILAAGVFYVAQVNYEKGVKSAEDSERYIHNLATEQTTFSVLAQIDLGGKPFSQKMRELEFIAPELHYAPMPEGLTGIRAALCVTVPMNNWGPWFGVPGLSRELPHNWTFEIVNPGKRATKIYPLPSPERNRLCLCVPYVTPDGLSRPSLCVKRDGDVVSTLPLHDFAPLRKRIYDQSNWTTPITIEAFRNPTQPEKAMNPSWFPPRNWDPQPTYYRVRLTKPLPVGRTGYVRLEGTEYADASENKQWTELKDSEAVLVSPCGDIAKRAEVRLIVGTPQDVERSITAPIGRIAVEYGQPTFIHSKTEWLNLSPTSAILLPTQGTVLRHPPSHARRSIHISAYIPRQWSDSPQKFPDLVRHVKWISPDPGQLGLNTISLPWGEVKAASRIRYDVPTGPIMATMQCSLMCLKVSQSLTAVVPISDVGCGRP
jgi:hypothetical protein